VLGLARARREAGESRRAQERGIEHEIVGVGSHAHADGRGLRAYIARERVKGGRLINPGKVGHAGYNAIGYGAGVGDGHCSRLATGRGKQVVDRREATGLVLHVSNLGQGGSCPAAGGESDRGNGAGAVVAIGRHADQHEAIHACACGVANGDGADAIGCAAGNRAVQCYGVDRLGRQRHMCGEDRRDAGHD